MTTTPSTAPASPTARTSLHEPEGQPRLPADPALRQAFEQALARGPKPGFEDEALAVPTGQPLPAVAPWPGNDRTIRVEADLLVFVSSQPVLAPAPQAAQASAAGGGSPAHAGGQALPMPAALAATLSALAIPASPEGVQHWQFSFSQPGSALSGVALTAQPDAPWQLQLQLPVYARDRSALDARLGELRQRLAGRGAHIGDIDFHSPLDAFETPDRPDRR